MKVIECEQNSALKDKINEFAEVLRVQAHTLGAHGLSEDEFYNSGLFRGAIERIRGQFAARMDEKRDFVRRVLNFLQDRGLIEDWISAGGSNRHDYSVQMPSGKRSVIELKGCLDGNNTNIFERPPHADEFIIWSVCTNPGADPRRNVWSGIHTRLSAEIISRNQRVDGLVVWDMVCGSLGRPCPKILGGRHSKTSLGPYDLPPPCIYIFPSTIPSPRNNPSPLAQDPMRLEFVQALMQGFGGDSDEINLVDFRVAYDGAETVRTTSVRRAGQIVAESDMTPIRRS